MMSINPLGIEFNAPVLIQLTIKATLLMVLILLGHCILRRTAASIRHLFLSVGLAFVCLLPVFSRLLPTWPIPLSRSVQTTFGVNDNQDELTLPPLEASSKIPSGNVVRRLAVLAIPNKDTPLNWIAILLVSGGLLAAGRVLLGIIISRRQIASGMILSGPAGERISRLAGIVQSHLYLPGTIPIRFTPLVQVPQVCGVIKPVIILPADAADWSDRKLISVLEHEMAHIKRRDNLLWPLINIVAISQWFNPLVWYVLSQIRLEMEKACDDYVLLLGNSGTSYAGHLLEMCKDARHSVRFQPISLAQVRKNTVVERITYILNGQINRQAASIGRRIVIVSMFLCLALPITLIHGSDSSSPILSGVSEEQKQGIIMALSTFHNSSKAGMVPELPEADISTGRVVSIRRDGDEFVATQVFEINNGGMTIRPSERSAGNSLVITKKIVPGDQPEETSCRLTGLFERQIRLREKNGQFIITDKAPGSERIGTP
jgi:beta-lactamase regulating signal transducer with metallopeptidase domain